MQNIIDCHTHSKNSNDAKNTVHEMCQQAIKLGLLAYAITDHCECDRYYDFNYYKLPPDNYDTYNSEKFIELSLMETDKLKESLNGKFNLLCGVELGQPTFNFEVANKVVSDKRLDFVIGSMHQIQNHDDFCFLDFKKYDVNELMKAYFKEIYKLCQWGNFDVLGHLTYPLRYIEGEYGISVDLKSYEEIIRESFKLIILNNKGIEINTSGLRQKYKNTFPLFKYIKIYKELGGEIISIGSDAHCVQDLGFGITDGISLAKRAGFKYLTYFKKRVPHFLPIEK